jgi:hypothetical protein
MKFLNNAGQIVRNIVISGGKAYFIAPMITRGDFAALAAIGVYREVYATNFAPLGYKAPVLAPGADGINCMLRAASGTDSEQLEAFRAQVSLVAMAECNRRITSQIEPLYMPAERDAWTELAQEAQTVADGGARGILLIKELQGMTDTQATAYVQMILTKRDIFVTLRATCVRARDAILSDISAAATVSDLQTIKSNIPTDPRWNALPT